MLPRRRPCSTSNFSVPASILWWSRWKTQARNSSYSFKKAPFTFSLGLWPLTLEASWIFLFCQPFRARKCRLGVFVASISNPLQIKQIVSAGSSAGNCCARVVRSMHCKGNHYPLMPVPHTAVLKYQSPEQWLLLFLLLLLLFSPLHCPPALKHTS